MSVVIAVDGKNDLYIGPSGSLALATGLEAVMQACQQAAQTQLGEMIYATDQGLPNFAAVWNGAPNVAQFEAYLRRMLAQVDGVTAVIDATVTVTNNALRYTATIETIYGRGAING